MSTHFVLRSAALALGLVTSSLGAQSGAMRAAPSGRGTTEVVLTLVDSVARASAQPAKIRIDYGQPHLRGRRINTDSLVPFDKPWRLGANDPTTLTTDVDLVIGGANVPKGTYVLQTTPGHGAWKLHVLKAPPSPANANDPANEVARVDLRTSTSATPIESLSIWLVPSNAPGTPRGDLRIGWGTVLLTTEWSMR